jgi:hypothetical protein
MSTPHTDNYEAVKYCVSRCLAHEAPLDRLREYLDLLELNGWPAEKVSEIGNASCRILTIILEAGGAAKNQDQEGLVEFLLRQCRKGGQAKAPPKHRPGNRRHQPQPDSRKHESSGDRRSGEIRRRSPQSESG